MVELLAPAGSFDSLRAAVNAGADAVYIGGAMFGARAYADNPDEEHLNMGIDYCHLRGKKVYMTVNTLLKDRELEEQLYAYLLPYYRNGLDGVIVQDFGVMKLIQERFPGLEVHASTQMTVTGAQGARLLMEQGVTRVVPARELSLVEIRSIIEETGVEVETFIHGAMCYCYSGQCLFSSMLGGRSGNRGRCAQPCRLPYSVRYGEGFGVPGCKDASGKTKRYLLSMKDMCTLDLLPELMESGIASFKIEGRMKRPEYKAGVVSIYRKYMDLYLKVGKKGYRVEEEDRLMLMDLYNRGGFSDGYYKRHNGRNMMALQRPNHLGTKAARIKSVSGRKATAAALEPLHAGDVLELKPEQEITLGAAVKVGGTFMVQTGKASFLPGDIVYRTKNEALLEHLRRSYLEREPKEKIKGELRIFRDSPAILTLYHGECRVSVSREAAETAVQNPTPEAAVRKQICRTGSTPFVFDTLSVEMDENLFLPVKALNELRREGLERLQEEILNCAGRRGGFMEGPCRTASETGQKHGMEVSAAKQDSCRTASETGQKYCMTVLVTMPEQLRTVLEMETISVDTVYFDTLLLGRLDDKERLEWLGECILRLKERGTRCFLSCPPVLRERDKKFLEEPSAASLLKKMDGFLLHTLDQLSWFRDWIKKTESCAVLAADESLYAYNNRAQDFLKALGVSRITLPAELHCKELQKLGGSRTELNVYGHQALMQSAQCVVNHTAGCTGVPGIAYLRDRKNAEFPVLNRCNVCCNTILNSVALQLGGNKEEISRIAPEYVRLTFTVESGEETAGILTQYQGLLSDAGTAVEENPGGTRGHFRRGVE